MKNTKTKKQNKHQAVLLDEVLKYLDPKEGEAYLDLTAGYGGHASAVLARTLNPKQSVLVDRDENAVQSLREPFLASGADVIHADFLSVTRSLLQTDKRFDLILADLGVSSPHLDDPERGFSFQHEGPLDMRMDQRQSLNAAAVVNEYDEDRLVELLRRYGEEPRARRIAKSIIVARPLESTAQLAQVVAKAVPKGPFGSRRIHPATRTFQALRLEVNNELELLNQALPLWIQLLAPGGRLAVISFHSLEDRLVKQALAEHSGKRYDAVLNLLTKQPVTVSQTELVSNPRSRSAKLRAAVKIKNQKKGE